MFFLNYYLKTNLTWCPPATDLPLISGFELFLAIGQEEVSFLPRCLEKSMASAQMSVGSDGKFSKRPGTGQAGVDCNKSLVAVPVFRFRSGPHPARKHPRTALVE